MNIIYGCLLFFLLSSGLVFSQNIKHPPITPKWAFEQIVWEDNINKRSSAELLIDLHLKHSMPVGAIIIDSPWSTAYNNFDWDTIRYPKPSEMISNFQKHNVKTILWLTGCVNINSKDVPIKNDI
jgi:alpha-glucosidase (family GH31 glycosyl hydrolase)